MKIKVLSRHPFKGSGIKLSLKQRLQQKLLNHVQSCPCCQKRLALTNRVEVAFCLLKAQPRQSDLLSRANASALNSLKHSLRYAQKADKLRATHQTRPWFSRVRPLAEQVLNVAACLFVLLMIRCGIFNSLKDYKNQGQTVLHNYYAKNLDNQLLDEVFGDDTEIT